MTDLLELILHDYKLERSAERVTVPGDEAMPSPEGVLGTQWSESDVPAAADLRDALAELVQRCTALHEQLPVGVAIPITLPDGASTTLPTADEVLSWQGGSPTLVDIDRRRRFMYYHASAGDPDVLLRLPVTALARKVQQAADDQTLASLEDSAHDDPIDPAVRLREYFAIKVSSLEEAVRSAERAARSPLEVLSDEFSLSDALRSIGSEALAPLTRQLLDSDAADPTTSAMLTDWGLNSPTTDKVVAELHNMRNMLARMKVLLNVLQAERVTHVLRWLTEAEGALEDAAIAQLNSVRAKAAAMLFSEVIMPQLTQAFTSYSEVPVFARLQDDLATFAVSYLRKLQHELAGLADQDQRDAKRTVRQVDSLFAVKLGNSQLLLMDKLIETLDTLLSAQDPLSQLLQKRATVVWPLV